MAIEARDIGKEQRFPDEDRELTLVIGLEARAALEEIAQRRHTNLGGAMLNALTTELAIVRQPAGSRYNQKARWQANRTHL